MPVRWPYRFTVVGFVCLLAAWGCSGSSTAPATETDSESEPQATPENPLAGFVTVAPGVILHYLDFGGTGDPLLLLPGLGNSAEVFRDFAPRLTDAYSVRALTRRGFGQSTKPAGGYDRATLAQDIRAVLDHLGITTVHLVGHSIAGGEINRFAVDHPDRLGRVVYLDAAYDRTATLEDDWNADWQIPPPAEAADLASRSAYRAYITRVLGVTFPLEEISATTQVAPDGALTGFVTPASVTQAMIDGAEEPPYASITVPALALYSLPVSPSDVFGWLSPSSEHWDEAQAWLDATYLPWFAEQRAQFDDGVANGTSVEIAGAHHYLFLSDGSRVAAEVLAFLAGG